MSGVFGTVKICTFFKIPWIGGKDTILKILDFVFGFKNQVNSYVGCLFLYKNQVLY